MTTITLDAWDRGQALSVHGWVYGLHDGRVRDLGLDVTGRSMLADRYQAALAALVKA